MPQVFDDRDPRPNSRRDEVRVLLGNEDAWAQARRTTLNAHYTSAPVVQAMWAIASGLGFEGGRVLEPGCGSGNFIGFAPDTAFITGIELDQTTAEIAQHLYGSRATIEVGGFEGLTRAEGSFDLVIGNVPFGQTHPHDRTYNRGRHSLHNYFLIKSLHLVRPGGLVIALTSRYTLDAQGTTARQEMAGLADLVGALRLPSGAFSESSGTDVVIDLVVLRRRVTDEPALDRAWTETTTPDLEDADGLVVNEYFTAHPDAVLGTLGTKRGVYRNREITVVPSDDLESRLAEGVEALIAQAHRDGTGMSAPATTEVPSLEPDHRTLPAGDFETTWAEDGSFVVDRRGRIAQMSAGQPLAYAPRVEKDRAELVRLIGLRDAVRAVLEAQLDPRATDDALSQAQETLTERYGAYLRLYGPINRSNQARTGRRDPQTGEDVLRRVRPRMGGFRADPDWPLVAALEDYDEDTQQARPAAVFTQRVVAPPAPRDRIGTPAEAVAVCLDEAGQVTIERVAELLDTDPVDARAQLGDLVYDDPESGALLPASQYLAGNVRQRLAAAREAAAEDPRFAGNVPALEAVEPSQLEPAEIKARPGATWIPPSDVEQFCSEVLDLGVDVERLPEIGTWTTKLRSGNRRSVAATSEWGTSRADALALLDAALNQRLYTVTDQTPEGGRVRNDRETLAARDKQEQLAERFSTWVWEEPGRARRLASAYNELFSSWVVPRHDGSHLTFPGLAETFVPRPHQRDAVARILADGRVLLAHAVGAGKTATMVMAAMELRRLGAVAKPAVVVPNHMLEQFTREWLQLYPTARILVADRDRLSRDGRKEFVARAATGDWDAIIFSHSGFARMPLRADTLAEYLGEEIDRARQALGTSQSGKALSVKRLERRIAQMEETYKRLLDEGSKDDGVCFEQTGIDYLFVDEAHLYKNRRIDSNIDGVAAAGSQRSQDLDAKLWALRRDHGPRCTTFATATPVANSVAELWVMETYLHPDLLEIVGLRDFDSWAATFGRTHTALELSPDGSSYRMQTRFARFQNIPELLLLYRQVADIQTSEDLGLPTPAIVGGKAATVVVDPSDDLLAYVGDLAARAERVRAGIVKPDEDNMLKVTGDGRRAALDLRLVGLDQPDNGKVRKAAHRIAGIYHATHDRTYEDEHGQLTLRPGALQLVFCDVSTPASPTGWNAYDELRDALVQRGVPADRIRYIQEAKSDQAKAALFRASREGAVSVLIGSTETMGVGTNVQKRVVAIHHLDAPWRPADIEQRDGRGVRQGNLNPDIHVVRYVTERSFDIFMWQCLERKAHFIGQVTKGDIAVREIEDIGDQTLSFQEVKALATGDPLILEKAELDTEVARLARQERAHHDDQRNLQRTHRVADTRVEHLTPTVVALEAAVDRLTDTRGDAFAMTVEGAAHTKRADAGAHLHHQVSDLIAAHHRLAPAPVAELAGHTIEVELRRTDEEHEVVFTVPGTKVSSGYLVNEWPQCDPTALVQRLEHRLHRLHNDLARARSDLGEARDQRDRAATRLDQPWPEADHLSSLRRRQAQITAELMPEDDQVETLQPDQPRHSTDAIRQRLDAVGHRAPQREVSRA